MKNQLLAFALMSAAFVSCTDDSYDLDNISTDFRIGLNEYLPIARSEVKLKDLLTEFKTDYISEDPDDGVLNFKFDNNNRVWIKPIEINFEETSYAQNFREVAKEVITNNSIQEGRSFSVDVPIKMSVDGDDGEGKVSSIDIKEGKVLFRLDCNALDYEDIVITSVQIPGVGNYDNIGWDEETNAIILDLSNQRLVFPDDELVALITLQAKKEIRLTDSNVNFKVVMVGGEKPFTYRKIEGVFSSKTTQLERTDFELNLFDDNIAPDLNLNIVNPTLTITAHTNSGIPMAVSMNSLVGKHKANKSSKRDSVQAVFFGDVTYYDFEVDYAKKENERAQAFSKEFNKINGGLDKIFSYLPDSISVECGMRINSSLDAGVNYFMLDSTYMDFDIEAFVPLQLGNGSRMTIKDTIDGIDIVEEITNYQDASFQLDQAEVVIEFENKLPFVVDITAKFCVADSTESGVKLTYLNTKLDQRVRVEAAKSSDGFIVSAQPSVTKINVTDDMVDDLKKINAVDFTYKISIPEGTSNVDGTFLTKDSGMSAKIYGHVKANISNTEK